MKGVRLSATALHRAELVVKELEGPSQLLVASAPPSCRGDWIRTSDLLNPIQEGRCTETVEKSPAARVTAFYELHGLHGQASFPPLSVQISAIAAEAFLHTSTANRRLRCRAQALSSLPQPSPPSLCPHGVSDWVP